MAVAANGTQGTVGGDAGTSGPWPAPAKLNLFLNIVGRRADGYHLLQTVFQFIDFSDELYFSVRDDGIIRQTQAVQDISPAIDLTLAAARLLQATTGSTLGVDIRLDKKLPVGGGLGGGSSDAATVLVVLNRLWQTGLQIHELAALGLELGADVPVFVRGQAAWGEGVGEDLRPIALPEPWFLVILPDVRVSTAEVFSDAQLTRDAPPITIADFLAGGGLNNCEPVVRRRYPEVAEALDWLGRYAAPRLTGTGACVFAAFQWRETAENVLSRLPGGWRGLVAQGRNRSPLIEALDTAF